MPLAIAIVSSAAKTKQITKKQVGNLETLFYEVKIGVNGYEDCK